MPRHAIAGSIQIGDTIEIDGSRAQVQDKVNHGTGEITLVFTGSREDITVSAWRLFTVVE